jgi:ABC-type transport system involved in multi-copper enzyme maturation permease subunit
MDSPSIIYVLRWLVADTFRQARATRVYWLMLAISGLCIAFCLSVSLEGGGNLRPEGDYLYNPRTDQPLDGPSADLGQMNLLFGAVRVQLFRDGPSAVHMLQVVLGTWVAGGVGLLLTLVWTAGFLPEFLQPGNATLLFAKPVPRWLFLVGRFLGVVLFVAFQGAIFFAGTWLALGIKTNVWLGGYLAGLPLLVFHFAVVYSFSALLAVLTRSTLACILGVVLFWIACLGINYGRHAVLALPVLAPEARPLSPLSSFAAEVGYWILPKPADMIVILEQAYQAGDHMTGLSHLPEFQYVLARERFDASLSLFTSLLFCLAMLAVAGRQLAEVDY